MSAMRFLPLTAAVAAIATVAVVAPAPAQMKIGGLGFRLVKAVKDNDVGAFGEITRQNGGNLNSAVLDYESDGETALLTAVRLNRRAFVNDLLYYGANPNKAGGAGDTPLTLAITIRNDDLVELLLKGGAQADLPNRRGETPLIKAVQVRDIALVELLLQKGANPDKADFTGQSARRYADADTRNPVIARAIAAAPKAAARPVSGPRRN